MAHNLHQPRNINYNLFNNIKVELAEGIELTNNVAGAEIAVPLATSAWFPVRVNFSVNGILRLPPLSQVPYNYEYLFSRPPGSAIASTNMVAIAATVPDTIDGRAGINTFNAPVYLDINNSNGTGVRIRAGKHCWHAVGGWLASEGVDATNPILPWSGINLIRCNSAAAVFTLPLLSATMGSTMGRGMLGLIYANQACTIQCAGTNVFQGSVNGVIYNLVNSFPLAQGESAIVSPVGSNAWFVH